MFIFYRTLEWVRWACGIVPKSAIGSPRVYYVFYYIFLGLIALLLAVFTEPILEAFAPDLYIKFDRQKGLLGILFLLSYAIIRVVLKLVELFGIEEEAEFPDIQSDWDKILAEMDRDNLALDDLPLFLVNGLTPFQEQSVFEGAFENQPEFVWRLVAPRNTQENTSIRVYVNDDAVFLSCTGIGATNFQQGRIKTVVTPPPSNRAAFGGRQAYPTQRGIPATAEGGRQDLQRAGILPDTPGQAVAPASGRLKSLGTMSPGGLRKALQTMRSSSVVDKGYGKQQLSPLSPWELEVGSRRMKFLCKLIDEQRYPYVQINGLLQAFPLSWTTDVDYATRLAPSIREDLVAVHSAFQLQFPLVVAITELDHLQGVGDFVQQIQDIQSGIQLTRAGSSFAPGAEVSDRNATSLIDSAISWFHGWTYVAFGTAIDACPGNQKLFQLLCEISQRRKSLSTMLRDVLYKRIRPDVQLYGVYFAATGKGNFERAFLRGLLSKLEENRGKLAWAPELIESQKRSQWLSRVSVGASIIMALTSAAIIIFGIVFKKGSP